MPQLYKSTNFIKARYSFKPRLLFYFIASFPDLRFKIEIRLTADFFGRYLCYYRGGNLFSLLSVSAHFGCFEVAYSILMVLTWRFTLFQVFRDFIHLIEACIDIRQRRKQARNCHCDFALAACFICAHLLHKRDRTSTVD